MLQTDSIGELELSLLAKHCAAETSKFLQKVVSDTQYCYELFRRALVHHNQQAYTMVVETYRQLLTRQVRKKLHTPFAEEDVEECVNFAFANCFRYLRTQESFAQFPTLGHILAYLKACTNAAAESRNRKYAPWSGRQVELTEFDQPEDEADIEELVLDKERKDKFYALITSHCKTEEERVLLEYYVELGLKPREIYAQRPDLFADVKHVHRVKQILLERLKRLLEQYKEEFK